MFVEGLIIGICAILLGYFIGIVETLKSEKIGTINSIMLSFLSVGCTAAVLSRCMRKPFLKHVSTVKKVKTSVNLFPFVLSLVSEEVAEVLERTNASRLSPRIRYKSLSNKKKNIVRSIHKEIEEIGRYCIPN